MTYRTQGTCSTLIDLKLDEGRVVSVNFSNGCGGNLQAVSRLVEGMDARDAIEKLRGIQCRNNTSCPDQLARALEEALAANGK